MKKRILLLLGIVCVFACLASLVFATEPPQTAIVGHNLALEDNVQIVYYVDTNADADVEHGMLFWLSPQEAYTYGTEEYKLTSNQGTYQKDAHTTYLRYAFTALSAKMMTVDVYAVSYIKDGDQIVYSAPDKYSILQYATRKKDSTTVMQDGGVTLGELVAATMNYGAAAQAFTGYHTDRMANATYYEIKAVGGVLPDGMDKGVYQSGKTVKLTAAAAPAGKVFCHWQNAAGENVGQSRTLTLTVLEAGTYTAVYAAADHGTWHAEIPATCTAAGVAGHYHCDACGRDFDASHNALTGTALFATGHDFGNWIAEVPATAQTDGVKGHYHCNACGGDFDVHHAPLADLTIPATGETAGTPIVVTTDAELRSAVSNAKDGDVIVIANDIALTTNMTATKRITLKGPDSGSAVTVSRAGLLLNIQTGGDVTLGANLVMLGTGSTQTIQSASGSQNAKLTIDGATVRHTTTNAHTLNMYGNGVTVTLKSGSVENASTNNGHGVITFQTSTNAIFVMTGGSVLATANAASKSSGVYFNSNSASPSCDITGGTISGGYAGVRFVKPVAQAKFGGTVTVTATERSPIYSDFTGDGTGISNFAFTGGTYTGSTSYATVQLTSTGTGGTYYTLHISGGTFRNVGTGHLFSIASNATITEGVISGGNFFIPRDKRCFDLTSGSSVSGSHLTVTGGVFDGEGVGAYGIYVGTGKPSVIRVFGGTFRGFTWACVGIQASGSTLITGAPENYTPATSPICHNPLTALQLENNIAYTLYNDKTVNFTNNTGMNATMYGNSCVLSEKPSGDVMSAIVYQSNEFTPVLRFAVASDVHFVDTATVRDEKFAQMFENAYAYSDAHETYRSLDGVFVVGDISNNGSRTSFERFFAALTGNAREGTITVATLGNHEFVLDAATTVATYLDVSGYESDDQHLVINGYHFILLSPDKKGRGYSEVKRTWLDEQLSAALADDPTGTKPIFVFQHQGVKGTVYGTEATWGLTDLASVLSKYPQVVDFAGHSHFPINDPRSVWQGLFTAFNTGSFKGLEMDLVGVASEMIYAGDTVGGWHTGDGTSRADGGQYYIVEVDAYNRILVQAFDASTNLPVMEPILIETVGDPAQFVYTDARAEQEELPAFAADATVSTGAITAESAQFTFPRATSGSFVQNYRCEIFSGETLVATVYRLDDGFLSPAPETLLLPIEGLQAGTEYTVRIVPVSAWGNEGEPLCFAFTTPAQ